MLSIGFKHGLFVLALAVGTSAFAQSKSDTTKPAIRVTAADNVRFTPLDPKAGDKGPQFSVVFGEMNKKTPVGLLLKLPAGFRPAPHIHTSDDYAVIIKGTVYNFAPGGSEGTAVTAGGNWFQPGKGVHDNHCTADSECLLFVYLPKGFDFKVPPKAAATKK